MVDHVFLELLLYLVLNGWVLVYLEMVRRSLRIPWMVVLEGAAMELEWLHLSVMSVHLFILIPHIVVRVSTVKMIAMFGWRATAITIGFEGT